MNSINVDIFFKIFIFSNSYEMLRQFVSLNYSIEISNKYEEAIEYITQSHRRRPFHFILIDAECADFFDCIRLQAALKKDFPDIKRVLVVNRKLSAEDEQVIKETFDAGYVLNLHTTDDFFMFFRKAIEEQNVNK